MNKVILIGHVGDEVKVHHFEGGGSVGRFPLATDDSYKNQQGEKVQVTDWHNVVVRNKLTDIFSKYVKKGDKICVEGKSKTRQYEVDGQKRYATEVIVHSFEFISSKNNSTSNQGGGPAPGNNEPDDLPF